MISILAKTLKYFLRLLPHSHLGNRVFYFIYFIYSQRRFPDNRKNISNYFYKIKSSDKGYDPLLAFISDKSYVKDYISLKLGEQYCVPTIKVCDSFDEFGKFNLPPSCCIKPTHLSGEVIFKHSDNDEIDLKKIQEWFNTNYYYLSREKNYRFLSPRVIIEELVFGSDKNEDLKFFCYQGKLRFIQIDLNRWTNHSRIYFDKEWNKLDFSISKRISDEDYPKPSNLEIMVSLAEKVSKDFEFIRVDFYTDESQIFIGELTNLPEAGNGNFIPPESEDLASKIFFE